ncbi:MAG: helix-turn-helix domain-containing protein, partial [Shimia sp.]
QAYRALRLGRARALLRDTDRPVAAIAAACGFPSPVHFSRAYKAEFGTPPLRDRIANRLPAGRAPV